MEEKNTSNSKIAAIIKPRIHHQKKQKLEDVAPLKTPFSVHIDVCSLCNFRCSFCFQADKLGKKEKNFPHGMMKMDLFKKTVDNLKTFPDRIKKLKLEIMENQLYIHCFLNLLSMQENLMWQILLRFLPMDQN